MQTADEAMEGTDQILGGRYAMGDFVCDVCDKVCNTARGHFWARKLNTLSPETKGKALCWHCMPKEHQEEMWKPRHELPLYDGVMKVENR